MTDVLRHIWDVISNGARFIDWMALGVESVFLGVILYFEIVGERRHRKQLESKRQVEQILKILYGFMERGQQLQRAIPPRLYPPADDAPRKIEEWINHVRVWGKETGNLLAKYSPTAAITFSLITETGVLANPQIVHMESGDSFPIEGSQKEAYQTLVAQLNNLRRIMEKAEFYFLKPCSLI